MAAGARELARAVLKRVRRDRAYANLVLSAALEGAHGISDQDRRLATELVYGVLRHQARLDHALARHAPRGLKRLDPEVLDALRLGAYQLLLLDRVPAHAAVNDAVGAIRRRRGAKMAGFANAVLRRLSADDLGAAMPHQPERRLALECSLPQPLARHWLRQLGPEEARQLGQALLQRAPFTVRCNTLRAPVDELERQLSDGGVRVQRGRWAPQALRLLGGPDGPLALPALADGQALVQDEAAQLVALALGPAPGQRLLDACAGVGGKATHLAQLMGDRGQVVAVDPNGRKLELLEQQCRRLQLGCVSPLEQDLRQLEPGPGFDGVLLDAPCSGLGVLRRHPELKWREGAGLEAVPRLVQLQRELLSAAVGALRPGAALVYSVCSVTEQEGPEQVRWVLSEYPALQLEPLPRAVSLFAEAGGQGTLRLWPHRHDTDGFFIARLRRVG